LETKGGAVAKTWGIDLKNGNGACKESKIDNPDATFTMVD